MNIPVSLNSSNYGAFPDKGFVKIIVLIEFSPQSTVHGPRLKNSREPGVMSRESRVESPET